jgi:EAL domain-containing protein (putative c-di-GMP-specific phosphodiesterase class I)
LQANIKELLTYCMVSETKLILAGVETREDLNVAIDCGAELLQGNFFGISSRHLDFDKVIEKKLNCSNSADEAIV